MKDKKILLIQFFLVEAKERYVVRDYWIHLYSKRRKDFFWMSEPQKEKVNYFIFLFFQKKSISRLSFTSCRVYLVRIWYVWESMFV